MSTFEQEVEDLTKEIAALVISKQKDYGKKNILNSVVDPKLAVVVRLNDKIARLANLVQSDGLPQNESLKDTANDIIGYGFVLRMLLDNTFETLLEEDVV